MEQEKKQPDVRLIGLDLDGTTLTSDKVLTPHTKEVLEKCLAEGIQVLPATGRVKSGIPEYLTQIEGMRYVILSNGASVLDLKEDKVLYQNCIPWERALELFDVLARFYDNVENYGIEKHIEKLVRTSRNRIDDLREWMKENKAPVEKINMFFAKEEDRQRAFRELGQIEDLAVTCSLGNNLEINGATCNKGDAMLNLGKILDIPIESIMACGDGNNDFEMVKMAGVGVAMKNGEESLKEVADFVTKTNDEEGVAYAIEHFCNV